MRKRKPSKNTQRKAPSVEELDALIPPLPEDHPLYTQGWVIGQTFRGWSPAEARKWSETMVDWTALRLERYQAIIEREYVPTLPAHEAILIETLKGKNRPLSADEIATLPAMVEDWCRRNPDYMPAPAETFLMILRNCDYPSLVALVDRIERGLP